MIAPTIITGTNDQINRSKTLNTIVEQSNNLHLVHWFGNETVETVFNTSKFSNTTDTVLVFTNNKDFSFVEFYLYYATTHFFTVTNIEFIFICAHNPFEQTTEISKRFNVLNVAGLDKDIAASNFQQLTIYQLDNKIASLLQMIDDCQEAKNFTEAEKTMFCDLYKKMIMEAHMECLQYRDHSSKEILSTINI